MIPVINILANQITEINYPSRTYKINFADPDNVSVGVGTLSLTMVRDVENKETLDRISGYIDDVDAVIQAIYLILSTERYRFPIYSWDYGVELLDLFGKPIDYVMAVLPNRIKEALMVDNRVSDVVNFTFSKHKNTLTATFTVVTTIGDVAAEMEVML